MAYKALLWGLAVRVAALALYEVKDGGRCKVLLAARVLSERSNK